MSQQAAGLNCPARMTRSNTRRAAAVAALIEAASRGDCSSVQHLLADGAQVNSTDAEGATALHKAAAGGHAEVVRILLTAQADPNAGTAPHSALWLALDSDAAGAGEVLQLLVSAGANTLTAHPTTGAPWHILFAAATESKVRWIQRLIAAGCSPDVEGPPEGGFSRTPLVLAIKTGSLEAAVELLRSGAAPDTREVAMCLVAAALAGCEAMLQQLADAGADMSLAIYAAAVLLGATTAAEGTGSGARLESSVQPVVAAAVAPARAHASAALSTAATASTTSVQPRLPAATGDAAGNAAGAATAEVGTTAAAQLGTDAPVGERPAREQTAQAGTGVAAATRPVGRARARADIRLPTGTTAAEERAAMQLLIRVAGGIDATGYRGGTALHTAAVHGATEAVQVLLQHGAALDVAVEHGVTALGLACCNREVAVVQLLLAAGAKPSGSDVLCAAAAEGAEADLQSFLTAGAPATETEPGTGSTALYFAARNGVSAATIQQLLAAGADVNAKDTSGLTPLHGAAVFGHAHTLRALLHEGADVHATDVDGNTVLHVAGLHGPSIEVVQLLVDTGAQVDARNRLQATPLHVAVIRQHYHVVQALIAAGADVRARDATANTVLHFAAEHGGTEEVVQQLIAAGADLAARDRAGATPLLVAVDGQQLGVVQVLLAAGACANTPSHAGLSPLQLAVGGNNAQLVRMLLRAGANPNCHMPQLPSGVNALSLAVIKAGCEVVSALLDAGAEIAGPNDEYDAIEAAFETKKFEMIPLLLAHPRSRLSAPMLQEGLWQALMESEPVGPMYDLAGQLQLHLYKVQRQQELQAQLSVQPLALPVAEVMPPQELTEDVLASEDVVERRISRSTLSLALLQGWAADTAAVDAAGALLAGRERGGAAVAAAAREVLMQHAATRRAAACRAAL